jgi:hypothetical protein
MLAYRELTDELLRRFPQLQSVYDAECEWAGEETLRGAHVSFGDLLTPYLIGLLETDENPEVTTRIFAFLEELANHPDKIVQEVVALTVVERLTDKETWLAAAWPHMGPKTRRFAKEVAEYWGNSRDFPCA